MNCIHVGFCLSRNHSMSNKINNDEKHRITCANYQFTATLFRNSFDFNIRKFSSIFPLSLSLGVSHSLTLLSLFRSRNFLKAFQIAVIVQCPSWMNSTHFFGQANRFFHSLMKYVFFAHSLIAIKWILCKWNICMRSNEEEEEENGSMFIRKTTIKWMFLPMIVCVCVLQKF